MIYEKMKKGEVRLFSDLMEVQCYCDQNSTAKDKYSVELVSAIKVTRL